MAVRLADGKELLSNALTTIISNNSTTKMSNLAIRVIRKSVLPLMDIASTLTRTSANMVVKLLVVTMITREKLSVVRR